MTAPLLDSTALAPGAQLAIALAIGIAFGWTLERAGLGSARKLVGQFYLTDLTVFKVMFSAVVTAALGAFWLARAGLLDLERVYVPETYLMPQLVGGLLFGAGFALAGLCPGTSCVSAATGRGDGLAAALGMLGGVAAIGVAFPWLARFYVSTARGVWTLPQALGLSYGLVLLLLVVVAIAAFAAAERVERGGMTAVSLRRVLALAALLVGPAPRPNAADQSPNIPDSARPLGGIPPVALGGPRGTERPTKPPAVPADARKGGC